MRHLQTGWSFFPLRNLCLHLVFFDDNIELRRSVWGGRKVLRMPNRSMVLTIIAVALVFGATISGCKRDRDDRVAVNTSNPARRDQRPERIRDNRHAVRPAEVLSASAYRPRQQRPPARETLAYSQRPVTYAQPAPYRPQPAQAVYATSYNLPQVAEPLPEPVPVHQVFPHYSPEPVQHQAAAYYPAPVQQVYSTPQLAMAKSNVAAPAAPIYASPAQPMPPPVSVPALKSEQLIAPIPELEPTRFHRVAVAPPVGSHSRQPAGIRSSAPGTNLSERQRALAPLPQPPFNSGQGWVSSPATTAMRAPGF